MKTNTDKKQLAAKAAAIWAKHRRTGRGLTSAEKDIMSAAYYVGVLPKDPNYSLYQWVEDGCPAVSS